jgi:hypothetical protein
LRIADNPEKNSQGISRICSFKLSGKQIFGSRRKARETESLLNLLHELGK